MSVVSTLSNIISARKHKTRSVKVDLTRVKAFIYKNIVGSDSGLDEHCIQVRVTGK